MAQKIKFDSSSLIKRIKAEYGTMQAFAADMGISVTALSNRIHSRTPFSIQEIDTACRLLSIPAADVYECFFTVCIC